MPKTNSIRHEADSVAPHPGDIPTIAREMVKAGLKNVAEGEAILRRLRADGPLARAWVPNRVAHPKIEQPISDPRSVMLDMIESIITAERTGRKIVAGLALTELRKRHETFADDLPADERDWSAFVRKHVPLSPDLVNDLIGGMVHRGGMMRCTKCGTGAKCPCSCGAPYVGEQAWAMPVTETVTETRHPGGRPPSGKALTAAERKRKQRERQRNIAPPPPPDPDRDLIQEMHPDATSSEQRWQWSMSNAAGDAVAMGAYWNREFGNWQRFAPPTQLVTLAHQAAAAWKELAHDLERRRRHGKAEAAE